MHSTPRTPLVADAAAARCIPYMIDKLWPERPACQLPTNQFPEALARFHRWSIGAVVEPGAPPTFGQYLTCNPAQRCPGCTTGCHTESLVGDIHRCTNKNVILLVMGGSAAAPEWLRAEVLIAGAPRLSGVSIPILDPEGVVSFAFPVCGFIVKPCHHGGVTQKCLPHSADLDQMALRFREIMLWMRRDILAFDAARFAGAAA